MTKRFTLILIALLTLAAVACGGGGSDPASAPLTSASTATPALDAAAIERGAKLFEGTCSACHGFDAMGIEGLGKQLVGNAFIAPMTDREVLAFLLIGRPADHELNDTGVAMPPRGGNPALTDDDLLTIVAFLRSIG